MAAVSGLKEKELGKELSNKVRSTVIEAPEVLQC